MTSDNDTIEQRAQRRINAFRLASLQGPVLQGPPPVQSPGAPTFNFFFSQLEPEDRLRAVKEIRKGVAEDWEHKRESAINALGLKKAPPELRLRVYDEAFDDAHWAELAAKFPDRHMELWNDYVDLQERAAAGKLEL